MRKKILVRGPALTRSGYGEQTRFALRALRTYEDFFDIYLRPVNWGHTGWLADNTEERNWIDSLVGKTMIHEQQEDASYDMSLQVTIPQEWERMAPINIGYTAGTETTKISANWVEKSNLVDRIITVSDHTKSGFENTSYDGTDETTGERILGYKCETPIQTVNFATRKIEPEFIDLGKIDVGTPCDFNFLIVAQWSMRKNLENTLQWFVEEFKNEEVGLYLKINVVNNSIKDHEICRRRLKNFLNRWKGERKCKIYLLHGDLTDQQLIGLYQNPKINALINLAHGEGFGLPIFEAAQAALPVVAPNWSGHMDFMYAPKKDKKTGKTRMRPHFAHVEYTLQPIQEEAVWDPVLIKNSMWCFPQKQSYKKKLRDVYKNYGRYKKQAKVLQKYINENFTEEKQYKTFAEACLGSKVELEQAKHVFVSDMFASQYIGGAELSLQTLINKSPEHSVEINSDGVTEKTLEFYKDSNWVFGNYASLKADVMNQLINKGISYSVVEFDYKFCRFRNLELHEVMENKPCDCMTGDHGQLVQKFLSSASTVFFMSKKQMEIHLEYLKDLDPEKCVVLSSVFEEKTIDKIRDLREKYSKEKKPFWAVCGSPHWVKNAGAAKNWCAENNVDFVELNNMPYDQVLETLAAAKGLCFLPAGADTCPRLVIESKLLGCELVLNEHVQHTDEEWFNTDDLDKTEEYLKSVSERFWQAVAP